jgi:hypothetical protein
VANFLPKNEIFLRKFAPRSVHAASADYYGGFAPMPQVISDSTPKVVIKGIKKHNGFIPLSSYHEPQFERNLEAKRQPQPLRGRFALAKEAYLAQNSWLDAFAT